MNTISFVHLKKKKDILAHSTLTCLSRKNVNDHNPQTSNSFVTWHKKYKFSFLTKTLDRKVLSRVINFFTKKQGTFEFFQVPLHSRRIDDAATPAVTNSPKRQQIKLQANNFFVQWGWNDPPLNFSPQIPNKSLKITFTHCMTVLHKVHWIICIFYFRCLHWMTYSNSKPCFFMAALLHQMEISWMSSSFYISFTSSLKTKGSSDHWETEIK